MSKHLNPLEKEFLIRQYKSNTRIKMRDFCEANHISTGAFQKWIKQYVHRIAPCSRFVNRFSKTFQYFLQIFLIMLLL